MRHVSKKQFCESGSRPWNIMHMEPLKILQYIKNHHVKTQNLSEIYYVYFFSFQKYVQTGLDMEFSEKPNQELIVPNSVVHPDPDGSEIICKLGSGSVINSGSDSGSGFESGSKLSSASN
jgi:hypothetical protein